MRQLALAIVLVASTFTFTSHGTAAGCDSSGFGDESCTDIVSCNSGAQLSVSASVDEPGWVEGYVGCGGTSASCSASLSCNGSSASLTSSPGNGECRGAGNGGSWTVLSVGCGGVTAESSPIQEVVEMLKLHETVNTQDALADLLTPDEGSTTWILAVENAVAGYSCTAGEGCTPVPAQCRIDTASWACWIG